MESALRLAVVQFTPILHQFHENKKAAEQLLQSVEADIIVLPELCLTGYFFQSQDEALQAASHAQETLSWFTELAKRTNAIVCGGFAELADNNTVYNSSVLIIPETGEQHIYRKIHLFYKERYCFSAGNKPFFTVHNQQRDITIGMMICYDWRFPESARALALQGADLIVCPSNLVTDVWHLVMPARSIENKLYLAVANRAGTEEGGGESVTFKGKSAVYSYNGQAMAVADEHETTVLYADIFPSKTRDKSFNSENSLFTDRRPEMYSRLQE